MRKALLGTTALIAGGLMAGSVMAADLEPAPLPAPVDEGWEVVVGGFANAHVMYFNNNIPAPTAPDQDQTLVHWDSEIHFTASTTLANGIKIAVRVELEGINAGGGTPVDEAFMSIEGNFGRFEIGANDPAIDGLAITGPGYGYLGVDGSTFGSLANVTATAAPTGRLDGFSGDSNKVTYYTPRISGFQAGVSFAPNNTAGAGARAPLRAAGFGKNVMSAAANYNNTFNDVSIAFGAGIETAKAVTAGGPRRTHWNVGARVGMGGFTVGGNYSRQKIAALKDRTWVVSASYGTGPWTVGAGFLSGKRKGAAVNGTFTRFGGGASYALGTGVSLNADINRERRKNAGVSAKGYIISAGINTSF